MKRTMTLAATLAALCLAAPAMAADAPAAQTAQAASASAAAKAAPQRLRQPIPLSIGRVAKNIGKPGVYLFDCNPPEIYEQSHIKGAIHANVDGWMDLLPKDKEGSFLILYCINRMCNISYEASLKLIEMGYRNVYLMPDGIQGWVSNGYEFEGTGREDIGIAEVRTKRAAAGK